MLPALRLGFVLIASGTVASSVAAQQRVRVTAQENFRLGPAGDATVLGRVNPGTELILGASNGDWREVTLEGWIWQQSIQRSSNPDFDLMVSTSGGENLRDRANGDVIARLETGTLLKEVGRGGGWVRVRRTAWMWGRSLAAVSAASGGASRAAPAARADSSSPASSAPARDEGDRLDRMTLVPGASLLANPGGDTLGETRARAPARVVTRADGWARVLVEAWVRESDLGPVEDSALTGVTAAEVRGSPATYEGRTLRWTLQYIALQTADELRRDMPLGQQYLLARGPLPETGFVYVLVTPDQARAMQTLDPLSRITVIARVRRARSQFLGNPILELVEYAVGSVP